MRRLSPRWLPRAHLAGAALLLLAAACDTSSGGASDSGDATGGSTGMASPCEGDMRGDDYAVGLAKTTDERTVTFVDASPAPPAKGDNTWTLRVTDTSGAPLPGLTMEVGTWMPDHGHGSPIVPTVTEDGEPGTYVIDPLNFFMAGLWEITITLSDPSGGASTDTVFRFCIDP